MSSEEEFERVESLDADSPIYVSKQYESFDYERFDNEISLQEEEERGKIFMASIVVQRIFLFVLTGFLIGIMGSLVEVGVHLVSELRYTFLKREINEYYKQSVMMILSYWFLSMIIPTMIGNLLVVLIEPKAIGGGAHWVLGYLNGINLAMYMNLKILIVKAFSLIFCVASGLPGGKEAPMIHMGAIIGNLVPLIGWRRFQPFVYFHVDPERRDLAAGGAASGLTAAFATPIASIFIAFEESLTYWNVELTFLIFVCVLITLFTFKFLADLIIHGNPGHQAEGGVFLENMRTSNQSYYLSEFPVFILLGASSGLLGAFWNYLQKLLGVFRKKYVNAKWKRVVEMIIITMVNSIMQVSMLYVVSVCWPKEAFAHEHDDESHVHLSCTNAETLPSNGLLVLQTQASIIQSLITKDEGLLFGITPLVVFFLYYYFASCWLAGSFISHGIFVPHILIGTVWGRLFAETMQHMYPDSANWARPNKYAFLCGAAQLSGSLRITLTISVLMLETCSCTHLCIPIFIVVTISKFVGNFFTEPLYHMQSNLAGLPMLQTDPPPFLSHIKAKEVMSEPPVTTIPISISARQIMALLAGNRHNGFPVVDPQSSSEEGTRSYGLLRGIILRTQLKAIVKNNLFDEYGFSTKEKMKAIRREFSSLLTYESVYVPPEDYNKTINLEPFMNPTPHFIHMNCSFSKAYRLFSGIGLRHLVIVNSGYEVVGLITRKDISIFRKETHLFETEIVKLPIR